MRNRNDRDHMMADGTDKPITELLVAMGGGDQSAHRELWRLVYEELKRVAQSQMRREKIGRTLQPTALVHEVYLRLFPDGKRAFNNRRHFFAAAAEAMRRIRIDDARKRNRMKRGGDQAPTSLAGLQDAQPPVIEDRSVLFEDDPEEVVAIDGALKKLAMEHPRKAEVVMYRYFSGLTGRETAEIMRVSPRTVDLDWRFARAWLHKEIT